MSKYWNIKSPITVHVEVTQACNERCRHCYNFERSDDFIPKKITKEDLDFTIKELIDNKVMHVIITGGEPLLAIDRAAYLAEKALKAGMTVSLNSNLLAADDEKMILLRNVGIDHILTTLHSFKEDVHDYIASTPGAFKKIIKGIQTAQKNGIRVTVNTILMDFNKDDIYETGKFVKSIGCNKFLANRTIPSPTNDNSLKKEFQVGMKEAQVMFDDLLRLKDELGMQIGTCRTVPQCFFSELEKYPEFLNRGCSAGKRHMLLNVNGDSHACVHESESYGNIHEIGIKGIWQNMCEWRSLKYIPFECQQCHLFDICDAGCRLVAQEINGSISAFDNLRKGAEHLKPYSKGVTENDIEAFIDRHYSVNPKFNYRKEEGFYIVRTLGARVDFLDDEIAESIIKLQKDNETISLDSFTGSKIDFLHLIKRDILI